MEGIVTHADLYEKIGALHARMDNVERRIEKIDRNVEHLAAAANMGRGVWWAATKFGGLLLVLAAAVAWTWDRLRPLVGKWSG